MWFIFTPPQIATFLSPPGFPFGFLPIPAWPGAMLPQPGMKQGMLCIDESCEVLTRDGPRRLADVQIGDELLTPDGDFRRVIDKDFGRVWAQRLDDYVKISVGDASVVLTRDHIIGGKPAGEWCDGDEMILSNGDVGTVFVESPVDSNLTPDQADLLAAALTISARNIRDKDRR